MTMATLVPKMDQWLDALGKDTSQRSVQEKVTAAKPADLTDACWADDGEKITETRTYILSQALGKAHSKGLGESIEIGLEWEGRHCLRGR